MATIKKAQNGAKSNLDIRRKAMAEPASKPKLSNNPLFKKASEIKDTTTYKAKNGTSFGMLSVKAGIDKNPKPTAADRIAGAKGLAKKGKTVKKKAQDGTSIADRLAAKTAERNTPGTLLRQGQRDRLSRIEAKNPERAMRVASRMVKRATANSSEMKKGGKVSAKKGCMSCGGKMKKK